MPDQAMPDQAMPDQGIPDQAMPDQAISDQPETDQATPYQPEPDQPAAPGGPPTVAEPAADPWAAPPSEPTAGPAFDSPAGEFSQQPPVYPPAPTPPEMPYAGPRPTPTPPPSILTAVKLMYVGAALSAISFLASLLTQDSVRDQALEGDPTLTESELDAIVTIGIVIGVFVGLIGILLWVWMAETNRRGKSWARIVATVLGALNILFTVVGLALGQSSGLVVVFSVISAALAAVILYLLYRPPESNAYYEAVADLRR
jgi:hypothetical protein